ncbi:MAG: methylenetetrahydrofolate reductase [NAD(P)H] [Sphingobacteriales bacterium]|nr:MAG: methylenetetrahydrofolate reductase [NAD(P)H] [Sphingobacteriales bacterium]
MKVTEHLANRQKTLLSFEILPPLKGKSIQSIYRILDELLEFHPPFINVTYHRAEYKFKQLENGLFEKIDVRKRPGTVGICAALAYKYGIDAVPHLVCGGFARSETEDALVDLNYLGINNVLLLRGDAVKPETHFVPEPKGNKNALELVQQVVNLNKGVYLEEELSNGFRTDFCIGVAGYPEKHIEAPNLKADLLYLKQKVDAGAHYIVTQMFYDNKKFTDFVIACRNIGIEVPIIPGLKPITRKKQVHSLPSTFNISIPEDLTDALHSCKTDEAAEQLGIEWASQQCRELIEFGVPCLHFYTMSNTASVKQIMKQIF